MPPKAHAVKESQPENSPSSYSTNGLEQEMENCKAQLESWVQQSTSNLMQSVGQDRSIMTSPQLTKIHPIPFISLISIINSTLVLALFA
jgi:hypothetical protein